LTYLSSKYGTIISDTVSYEKITSGITPTIPNEAKSELEKEITLMELQEAVKRGKNNKARGPNGICHEYYKTMWDEGKDDLRDTMNSMFKDGAVTKDQKHGHIVCIPKTQHPTSPEHYRPLTILNTDYKILTRIIAQRLRIWMEDILHVNQYGGRKGNTIYDTAAAVRDIIAFTEINNTSLCLLSIDFKDAFDNISHEYLFKILGEYGIGDVMCRRLIEIYANATLTLILNGSRSKPIPIKCGVQ